MGDSGKLVPSAMSLVSRGFVRLWRGSGSKAARLCCASGHRPVPGGGRQVWQGRAGGTALAASDTLRFAAQRPVVADQDAAVERGVHSS